MRAAGFLALSSTTSTSPRTRLTTITMTTTTVTRADPKALRARPRQPPQRSPRAMDLSCQASTEPAQFASPMNLIRKLHCILAVLAVVGATTNLLVGCAGTQSGFSHAEGQGPESRLRVGDQLQIRL